MASEQHAGVDSESTVATRDPYQRDDKSVKEPPTTFLGSLPYIGPGFILSASIVGSGELIATTLAGAKAGFVLMWFIIFSCIIKVAVQLEFGKHAIVTGESTMASLNTLPGPRMGHASWSIWTWLFLMAFKMLQLGGIIGGVVLAIEQFIPEFDPEANRTTHVLLAFGVAFSVSLLVFRGYYQLIEKASLVMIGLFTVFTVTALLALQGTDFAISTQNLVDGIIPSVPSTAVLWVAIGTFGITGVGGDEIMAYNYWLIEKGYAAYTGPKNETAEWEARAKGWIRVMHWDALLAMVAYTLMTVMFYLLGAAVLHKLGTLPEQEQLISTLGMMYTKALGPWARGIFLVGAIVVLYSTLFSALAAWTRLFGDAFGRVGLYQFENRKSRMLSIAVLAWLLPVIWASMMVMSSNPAMMVILGGISTVFILLIVVFATLYFRYQRSDPRLIPSRFYDGMLIISSIAIVLVALLATNGIYQKITELLVKS